MLDFEVFWMSGPWEKKGKSEAQKRFTKTVKTQEDERLIQIARDEFADYCRRNSDWYRPRWGSTFMTSWRDWLKKDKTAPTGVLDATHDSAHQCEVCIEPHEWTCTDPLCTLEKTIPCPMWIAAFQRRQKRA